MSQEQFYSDIIRNAFAKAEKNYVNNRKYKLAEIISGKIEEDSNVIVTRETFVNYYNKYIEKKEGIAIPKHENIELLCHYIGYDSYQEFLQKKTNSTETKPIKGSFKNNRILIILWTFAILSVALGTYTIVSKRLNKDECMLWVNDHYEQVDCAGKQLEKPLDKETLSEMKQLFSLCKDDTFFLPDDSPVVWYDKHHKVLTFFTMPGIHPTNGKTLKPISQYIINKYVKDCE